MALTATNFETAKHGKRYDQYIALLEKAGCDQDPALHAAVYALAGLDKDYTEYITELVPGVMRINVNGLIQEQNRLGAKNAACIAIALSMYNLDYPLYLKNTFSYRSLIAGEACRLRFQK